jgi:hypothetical protein
MYSSTIFAVAVLYCATVVGQDKDVINPDLTELLKNKNITVFNRDVSIVTGPQNKNAIRLSEKEGYGVAWLKTVQIGDGTIAFDVKGRDKLQQSFVGIAFHGINDSTMDAIYFRPFNFQAQDPERRRHSVQYISLPAYDWPRLRTEFPNKYENAVSSTIQPNDWFHVRLSIKSGKISVYVNNNPNPDLVVDQLSNVKQGRIGFWVGNNSDGDFANLIITKE